MSASGVDAGGGSRAIDISGDGRLKASMIRREQSTMADVTDKCVDVDEKGVATPLNRTACKNENQFFCQWMHIDLSQYQFAAQCVPLCLNDPPSGSCAVTCTHFAAAMAMACDDFNTPPANGAYQSIVANLVQSVSDFRTLCCDVQDLAPANQNHVSWGMRLWKFMLCF